METAPNLQGIGREEEEKEELEHSLPSISTASLPEMENPQAGLAGDEEAPLSSSWEWGALLDFSIDDSSILGWDPDDPLVEPAPEQRPDPQDPSLGRVRKRDPRLTCENFLAGIVPCACPELDAKADEEEERRVVKKKARAESAVTVRCQVPGCEADIRELKGYHRRHRVCLQCANASTVSLDGQAMRYCQQCGKFHVLPDFDEGKRSCRRKLEKHNNRRRRKTTGNKNVAEKETQRNHPVDDVCDDEIGKETLDGVASAIDDLCLTNQLKDNELLFESEDGHGSAFCPVPSFQNNQSNSGASFDTSGETQTEEGKYHSMPELSSPFCNDKCAYSSVCPTGRMSFKLYDWNPAEFPRRLRHQIFQWLANMPVELEGYIRPGCTILTLFIAMPQFMWTKLAEDAFSYLSDLVNTRESLLAGRSAMRIYLNDMIFQVLKDGNSLTNIKMEAQAPRLHYVHPTCFEAGKPMEFVVCGSNLFQPKFRFLVSFGGKYLAYESCLAISQNETMSCDENTHSSDHEMFKIFIPRTESKLIGPAFIEVENESGLSNFIPVLVGDRQICSELQMIQQTFDKDIYSERMGGVWNSCQTFTSSKQKAVSELLLDVAWLLKKPQPDKNEIPLTSAQIQRLNCLLQFLIQNKCSSVLERLLQPVMKVLYSLKPNGVMNNTDDADTTFKKYVIQAREIVCQKLQHTERSVVHSESCSQMVSRPQIDIGTEILYTMPSTNQEVKVRIEDGLKSTETSSSQANDIYVPLINGEIVTGVNHCRHLIKGFEWPQSAYPQILPSSIKRTRVALFTIAAVAVCFGVCVALSHPHDVGKLAVSIRRCLFRGTKP